MVKYNKHTHEVLNVAITKEAMHNLRILASHLGISQKALIEIAIREMVDQEQDRKLRHQEPS